MATVGPLPFNKKDYDFDKDDCEKKDYHNKDSIVAINKTIPMDYLKIIAIIILLTSSVLMYNYEPTPRTIRDEIILKIKIIYYQIMKMKKQMIILMVFIHFIKFINVFNIQIQLLIHVIILIQVKLLLLAILSRASNVHIREAIRQTWGAVRTYNDIEIRLTFIVGVDDGMIKQIEIEQTIYHGKFY